MKNDHFNSIYKKYDSKDYFCKKDHLNTVLNNWRRSLNNNDPGASEYTEQDIIDHVNAKFYLLFRNMCAKIENAVNEKNVDLLKNTIRYDQKVSKEIFEFLTGLSLPKSNKEIKVAIDLYFS